MDDVSEAAWRLVRDQTPGSDSMPPPVSFPSPTTRPQSMPILTLSVCTHCPLSMSHTLTLLSPHAVASISEFGLKAMLSTGRLWRLTCRGVGETEQFSGGMFEHPPWGMTRGMTAQVQAGWSWHPMHIMTNGS